MNEVEFDTIDTIPVQDVLDARDVQVKVSNIRALITDTEFALQGYDVGSEDEFDVCDLLNLCYDDPVVCERKDVENAISFRDYETLKISDNRRGEEVKTLQKANLALKESMIEVLKTINKPWWKKLPGLFSKGVKQ